MLRITAFLFRIGQSIITLCDLYLSRPLPQRVSFTLSIPSSVGSVPGSFDLLFYAPSSYKGRYGIKSRARPSSPPLTDKHPVLINFHGGGFSIGHARDDARWATAVIKQTSAVVVSVNYRLAPEYPFPVGIEDCVSAVLWIWLHADEFNLDISRTTFSGFSAGGNFTYAVAIRLHEELDRIMSQRKLEAFTVGKLIGLVAFYGGTDSTQSRAERDASNPHLIPVIPPALFKFFDESYLYPSPDMNSPLLSPGKAPDQLLRDALPDQLVMINCAGDQLLAEALRFKTRLQSLGKRVDGYTVAGVGHAWDKRPSFFNGNVKRDEAYGLAIASLRAFWA
jgi:acetyl esterase/lipase